MSDVMQEMRAVVQQLPHHHACTMIRGLGEIERLRAELDALKAWKEEAEKQEPVAEVVWMAGLPNSMLEIQTYGLTPELGTKFYAHPIPPAPSVPKDVVVDYLVSISAHVAHQDDIKAQAEIGELLKMLAAAPKPEVK